MIFLKSIKCKHLLTKVFIVFVKEPDVLLAKGTVVQSNLPLKRRANLRLLESTGLEIFEERDF